MSFKQFLKYHEGKSQTYSLFKELQKSETEIFFFKNLKEAIDLRIDELTILKNNGGDSEILNRRLNDLSYLQQALEKRINLDIFS